MHLFSSELSNFKITPGTYIPIMKSIHTICNRAIEEPGDLTNYYILYAHIFEMIWQQFIDSVVEPGR